MSDEDPYVERVESLIDRFEKVEREVGHMADDLSRLADTGLEDDDLVLLLWGRKSDRTKRGTEDALDAIRDIGNKDPRDVMIRLTAAYGKMNLDEAEDLVEDLYTLRDRYGGGDGD